MKADSGCPLETPAALGYPREPRRSEGGSKTGGKHPERKGKVRTTDNASLPPIPPPLQSPQRGLHTTTSTHSMPPE